MTPEELVIGACLLNPDSIRFAQATLDPTDFSSEKYRTIFRAMAQLRKDGQPIEPFSVHTKTAQLGSRVEMAELHDWLTGVGSSASVSFYAEQVKDEATRRRLFLIAKQLLEASGNPSQRPSEAAQKAREALADVRGRSRMTTKTLAEILAIEEDHDWIIPGLLERGDRVVITGFEGAGKTTWIRQMVICMAAGIHPITLDHLEAPLGVLVVDAENHETQWRNATRGMAATARRYGLRDPAPVIDVRAGERLDITRDSVLGDIHRLIDEKKPDILCIGPLYKLVNTGINNDQEAAPVITALDSLRERGVALIMEAHAPKGSAQNPSRDLAPRGSAALMGWPEFGFGLYPEFDDDGETYRSKITRWRGDRDAGRDWPKWLEKGGPFPWSADNLHDTTRRNFYAA